VILSLLLLSLSLSLSIHTHTHRYVASGQTCVSAKRILIQDSIYDEFVEKLVRKVNSLRLLDPMDMNSHMGPLVHEVAFDKVQSQVNEAVDFGATVLTGGGKPSKERCPLTEQGPWFEPTVLEISDPKNPAFVEEVFGPCITVQRFRDEAHAVELANDSKYGLGGAVWTQNVARAHRVARDVEAGVFWVNAHHRNDPSAPWGGFKESGIGRENGWECFREYTETKTIVVRMSEEPEDWFGNPDARYS
jgi:phenylacetaldehyde dehydrogenase